MVQLKLSALFEDLPLFRTERRLSKRNKLESTSLKGLGDLLEIPPPGADLHLSALHLECPLPTAECLGLRMHVTKKNACARPGNSIDLTGEGFQIFQVADDEGRQHQVARRVAYRQSSAAPGAETTFLAQLDAGEKQHRGRDVDTEQASRRAIGQSL